MISFNRNTDVPSDLASQFEDAISTAGHWADVLEVLYKNRHFQDKLRTSANKAARRFKLPSGATEDIAQEALVLLGELMARDASLGYDPGRGDFGGFIATVLSNCCQRSRRRLFRRHIQSLDETEFEPEYNKTPDYDQHLDLHAALEQISEPYRSVLTMFCDGFSINEIAKAMNRTNRTIYRWMNLGTKQVREICFPEDRTINCDKANRCNAKPISAKNYFTKNPVADRASIGKR